MSTTTSPDIVRDFPRVSADIVKRAAQFQPAILADVNGRRGALHGRITALRPRFKLAGPALTVEVRPGDNLMIHAAMALAQPGDILVIDGKGDQTAALMGTIMINACRQLGIAGVVIDGAARDSLEIDELDFPVFSVGTNPNGPTKMVSERGAIEALLPLADKKVADEAKRIAQIKEGNTGSPWLAAALRAAGVLKEGETL
jgi:4-hydroxy-4-methyl-2-oxoglutarate aldolase